MNQRPFLHGIGMGQFVLGVGSLTALAMIAENHAALTAWAAHFVTTPAFLRLCIVIGVACVLAVVVIVTWAYFAPLNPDELLTDPSDSDPSTFCAVCDAPPKESSNG